MEITLREIDTQTLQYANRSDNSFIVKSQLLLNAENGRISYSVIDVPPYMKRYQPDEIDYATYISNPEKVVYFAFADGDLAGQIRVLKWWNAFAYIGSIVVDLKYRRQGIGQALIERVVDWAKAGGYPGLMLETQNNNAPACRLYERCGFVLGGFDGYLYKGLSRTTDDVALYWYLLFEG